MEPLLCCCAVLRPQTQPASSLTVTQSTMAPSYHAAEAIRLIYKLIYSVNITKYQPYGTHIWGSGTICDEAAAAGTILRLATFGIHFGYFII